MAKVEFELPCIGRYYKKKISTIFLVNLKYFNLKLGHIVAINNQAILQTNQKKCNIMFKILF